MPIVGTIRERLAAVRETDCIEFAPAETLCHDDAGAWLWDVLLPLDASFWRDHVVRAAARLREWRRIDVLLLPQREELLEHARRSNPT